MKLFFVQTVAALRPNTLILDHLNINHQKGRHDLVSAFYFNLLGLAPDPRKADNIAAGKGTIWANAGIHQFHLSEGKPDAQVLNGCVTLGYESLDRVRRRLDDGVPSVLECSKFSVAEAGGGSLALTDPWGSRFVLIDAEGDKRGRQPGLASEATAITDLTLEVAAGSPARLAGVGRFYEDLLGCAVVSCDEEKLVIATGGPPRADGSPRQTLTFLLTGQPVEHDESGLDDEGRPLNKGIHISLYLQDMRTAYRRADELGLTYVNHRFKRRAYSEEEAVKQCMFRMLDVVDPEDIDAGPILRLEHEVRSTTQADGRKYKSCPLDVVAAPCAN